jgi:serine/threonine protein kinase
MASRPQPTLLAGRYRLGERLGAGANSAVYAAVDERTGSALAVKRLHADRAEDAIVAERFAREVKAGASITSPRVVALFDSGLDDEGHPFLVMERVDGGTLQTHLANGALPVDEAIAIARELCLALDDLHAVGLVHRDLKPSNVLLVAGATDSATSEGPRLKLADLGLVKGHELGPRITQTTDTLGTLSFMAPEQIKAPHDVGPRADVFACGVLLHRMLTGENPFRAPDAMALLTAITTAPAPRLPAELEHREALQIVLDRALAKDPSSRFATARDLSEALHHVAHPAVAVARPADPPVMAPPTSPAMSRAVLVTAGALGIAVGFAAATLRPSSPARFEMHLTPTTIDLPAPTQAKPAAPPLASMRAPTPPATIDLPPVVTTADPARPSQSRPHAAPSAKKPAPIFEPPY